MKKATSFYRLLLSAWIILLLVPSVFGQSVADSPFKIPYNCLSTVSDKSGKPNKVDTWYFPADHFIDSSQTLVSVPEKQINDSMRANPRYEFLPGGKVLERQIRTRVDTFKLNWFSYYLSVLQQPVLYNCPLNKEIYRLTWIRSFHPPVVVSMEKKDNQIRLVTKIAAEVPKLPGFRTIDQNGNIHVVERVDKIPLRKQSVRKLTISDYDTFIRSLDWMKVLYASPLGFRNSFGSDGSEWILEVHRPEGYYFLVKWSPKTNEPLRILGDYLLNLSDAKKEERY